MLTLSKNLICEISSFLSLKELCILSSTCSILHKLSESDHLWHSSSDKGSGPTKKRLFTQRGRITHHIFNHLHQLFILSGHSHSINSIKVQNQKVLTASDDCTTRLYHTKKLHGKVLITHLSKATSSEFWENGIVSVSADRSLKVWQKEKDVKSVSAHKSGINQLRKINDTHVATGSYDGSIKIWDLNSCKVRTSNQDFDRDISLLETFEDLYVFASSNDNGICMRSLNKPQMVRKFEM